MSADRQPPTGPDDLAAALRRRVEAVVDVDAGLQDVLLAGLHADVQRSTAHVIDAEAGLRAIVPEPATEPATPPQPAPPRFVYYRYADFVVTNDHVILPGPRLFRLDELTGVHLVRGARRLGPAVVAVSVLAIVLGGLAAAWPRVDTAAEYLAAVTLPAAVVLACLLLRRRFAPVTSVIVGRYHNADVVLFSTSNPMVLGQVKRALMRAFEARSRDRDRDRHSLGRSWWRASFR